jgi:hypothetical protein
MNTTAVIKGPGDKGGSTKRGALYAGLFSLALMAALLIPASTADAGSDFAFSMHFSDGYYYDSSGIFFGFGTHIYRTGSSGLTATTGSSGLTATTGSSGLTATTRTIGATDGPGRTVPTEGMDTAMIGAGETTTGLIAGSAVIIDTTATGAGSVGGTRSTQLPEPDSRNCHGALTPVRAPFFALEKLSIPGKGDFPSEEKVLWMVPFGWGEVSLRLRPWL